MLCYHLSPIYLISMYVRYPKITPILNDLFRRGPTDRKGGEDKFAGTLSSLLWNFLQWSALSRKWFVFKHLGLQLSGKAGMDLAVLPKRIICSTRLPRQVWRTASRSTTIHQAWAKSSREVAKLSSLLGTAGFTKSLAAHNPLLLSQKMDYIHL